MGTLKRLEHKDGRFVELRLDTKRAYRFYERADTQPEFEHEECKGDAPHCEGMFSDRVSELLEAGFVVANNPRPELEVMTSLERFIEFVCRSQVLAYTDLKTREARATLKEEFGFKSLKAMDAESDAWAEYLYGAPAEAAIVDERHLAVCE